MFEPNEEEARRAEALSQAIMSTASSDVWQGHDAGTRIILARADKFEEWLKNGTQEQSGNEDAAKRPQGAFGAYQQGGLDASAKE